MVQEAKTVQVQIGRNMILPEGSHGSIVWVTPNRAKFLIDNGAASVFGGRQKVGPTETKGESAKKQQSPKKLVQSFSEAQAIQSTDTAKFETDGKEKQSPASVVGQASRKPKSKPLRKRTRKTK